MQITTDDIKTLRERTGAGVMDCKRALEGSKGNLDLAEDKLRTLGIASAAKKASRDTNQGVIETYVHSGGRIGAMVEVNCETDFVARTDDFSSLAHDIAMQVAAMSPRYLTSVNVPADEAARPDEICLLQQPFIKDPSITIQDLVTGVIGKLGENIRVRRFTRFSLGE